MFTHSPFERDCDSQFPSAQRFLNFIGHTSPRHWLYKLLEPVYRHAVEQPVPKRPNVADGSEFQLDGNHPCTEATPMKRFSIFLCMSLLYGRTAYRKTPIFMSFDPQKGPLIWTTFGESLDFFQKWSSKWFFEKRLLQTI